MAESVKSEIDPKLQEALYDIEVSSSFLARDLARVVHEAQAALVAMSEGRRVEGMHTSGPLGSQRPFDITMNTCKIESAVKMAKLLGATDEQIIDAYRIDAR